MLKSTRKIKRRNQKPSYTIEFALLREVLPRGTPYKLTELLPPRETKWNRSGEVTLCLSFQREIWLYIASEIPAQKRKMDKGRESSSRNIMEERL